MHDTLTLTPEQFIAWLFDHAQKWPDETTREAMLADLLGYLAEQGDGNE